MRRPLALLVLLAFVAATAAPALAACRMAGGQKECCCEPPAANAICAPDWCDTAKSARPTADVATHLRGFLPVGTPFLLVSSIVPSPARRVAPVPRVLVGLHERAAPRLPLRI
jgi:hypothetical protein